MQERRLCLQALIKHLENTLAALEACDKVTVTDNWDVHGSLNKDWTAENSDAHRGQSSAGNNWDGNIRVEMQKRLVSLLDQVMSKAFVKAGLGTPVQIDNTGGEGMSGSLTPHSIAKMLLHVLLNLPMHMLKQLRNVVFVELGMGLGWTGMLATLALELGWVCGLDIKDCNITSDKVYDISVSADCQLGVANALGVDVLNFIAVGRRFRQLLYRLLMDGFLWAILGGGMAGQFHADPNNTKRFPNMMPETATLTSNLWVVAFDFGWDLADKIMAWMRIGSDLRVAVYVCCCQFTTVKHNSDTILKVINSNPLRAGTGPKFRKVVVVPETQYEGLDVNMKGREKKKLLVFMCDDATPETNTGTSESQDWPCNLNDKQYADISDLPTLNTRSSTAHMKALKEAAVAKYKQGQHVDVRTVKAALKALDSSPNAFGQLAADALMSRMKQLGIDLQD